MLILFFDFPIYYVCVRRIKNTNYQDMKYQKSVYLYIFRDILGGEWAVYMYCARGVKGIVYYFFGMVNFRVESAMWLACE